MTTKIKIQPNRTFNSQQEMRAHIAKEFAGFDVVEVWHDVDGNLNCLLEGAPPREEAGKKKAKP